MLIHNIEKRKKRIEEKRSGLLSWLSRESVTHHSVVEELLDLGRVQTHRTLRSMEREGLLVKDSVPLPTGKVPLWGLTPKGAIDADILNESDDDDATAVSYERGSLGKSAVNHLIDVQLAGVRAFKSTVFSDFMSDRYVL